MGALRRGPRPYAGRLQPRERRLRARAPRRPGPLGGEGTRRPGRRRGRRARSSAASTRCTEHVATVMSRRLLIRESRVQVMPRGRSAGPAGRAVAGTPRRRPVGPRPRPGRADDRRRGPPRAPEGARRPGRGPRRGPACAPRRAAGGGRPGGRHHRPPARHRRTRRHDGRRSTCSALGRTSPTWSRPPTCSWPRRGGRVSAAPWSRRWASARRSWPATWPRSGRPHRPAWRCSCRPTGPTSSAPRSLRRSTTPAPRGHGPIAGWPGSPTATRSSASPTR